MRRGSSGSPCQGSPKRSRGRSEGKSTESTTCRIPSARIEEVLDGLRGTHKGGIRYPITQFMEYEDKFPPKYMEVNRMWDTGTGED